MKPLIERLMAEANKMANEEADLLNEAVDVGCSAIRLAEMILSDCGHSTAISTALRDRVAQRIQKHTDAQQGQASEQVLKLRPDFMAGYDAGMADAKRMAKLAQQEQGGAVAIYNGRCVIDCGEHGHHDIELLKMIPAGTKLYTAPPLPDREPLTEGQEREAFEKWALETLCGKEDLKRGRVSGYFEPELNEQWRGWKARAAHCIKKGGA